MSRIWKELNVSPEEQKLAEEIINSGAGKTLGQEALNQFHVRKEWNMEIETSVGKTLVHMYQDQPETKKSPRCLLMSTAVGLSKDGEIRISCSAETLEAEADVS